ncbi:MAG: hypothetical protein ACRES2_08505 [Steroidobacteraceae bacterium]
MAALVLALCCGGCNTLATSPVAMNSSLAGDWQQEPASSENFDSKLFAVIKAQRERMRQRRNRGGMGGGYGGRGGGYGGPGSEFDPLMQAPDEPDKERTRLADGLRPPTKLHIAQNADGVEITTDAEPSREFVPGQTVSRIDTSGAANVSSGWDQGAFVVRAKYTNRSSRSWHYEYEPASGMLRLDFETQDPEFGSFKLQTRYRRVSGNAT